MGGSGGAAQGDRAVRVLVTAGGTFEPIDAVRVVANVSTGRTGVRIARRLAEAGASVDLLLSEGARVAPPAIGGMRVLRFTTSWSLLARMMELVSAPDGPTWVVHAAAVSDFRPEPVAGKIPSDGGGFTLRLEPAPKVADRVAEACPALRWVLFKLEAGLADGALLERARRLLERLGADAVVANRVEEVQGERHRALVVRADGSVRRVETLDALADAVLEVLGLAARTAARGEGGA